MDPAACIASPADLAAIARFNATDVPFPDDVTLHALIEQTVAQCPDRVAVVCDHDPSVGASALTYAALDARANALAGRLRTEGVRPGSVVALMVERSFAMIVGALGILKAGGAYLPVATDHPAERIRFILADAGASVLLVHRATAGRVAAPGVRALDLDDPRLYAGPAVARVAVATPGDLAYVIYTSGSTGKPKGVMIEHRSVVNRLHWMQRRYPIGAGDTILQKTPYHFDVSVWELFWWALAGARVAFLAPGGERFPLAIVDAIRRHGVTTLHFVPSMLSVFLEYLDGRPHAVDGAMRTVRQVFASGEALSPSHVRRFHALWGSRTGARLANLYGPTEATVDVTYYDCLPGIEAERVPIGRPIDNTRLYVLRDGAQVPIGETGELCLAGVGLARGYLGNPGLTAEKFVDHPTAPGERIYRTGDVARWLPDGNVEYLGREDHQVKIRGLRIELGEIENVLRDHPDVADCAVVVRQPSETVALIVAFVVCRGPLDADALKEHLARHLPAYMVPNRFERLAALPLTPSGKTDRKALPEFTAAAAA
jgi:amino acid adenylation domain-containing protein